MLGVRGLRWPLDAFWMRSGWIGWVGVYGLERVEMGVAALRRGMMRLVE